MGGVCFVFWDAYERLFGLSLFGLWLFSFLFIPSLFGIYLLTSFFWSLCLFILWSFVCFFKLILKSCFANQIKNILLICSSCTNFPTNTRRLCASQLYMDEKKSTNKIRYKIP